MYRGLRFDLPSPAPQSSHHTTLRDIHTGTHSFQYRRKSIGHIGHTNTHRVQRRKKIYRHRDTQTVTYRV